MRRQKIDKTKIWQILSVYLLALIAALICGTGPNRSFAQNSTSTRTGAERTSRANAPVSHEKQGLIQSVD